MSNRGHFMSVVDKQNVELAIQLIAKRDSLEPEHRFQDRAACKGKDPDLFFASESKGKGDRPSLRVAEAKAVCAKCPVWVDCLLWSLQDSNSVRVGTYGRLSPEARRQLARQLNVTPAAPFDPIADYWGTTGWGLTLDKQKRRTGEAA